MPPKCCSQDIPIKLANPLFSTSFKKTWNKKLVEFSARNRVYCPYKRCGEWIKPESIFRTEDGRKCAKCSECKMKVCCSCNGKWHSSRKCPRDEETSKVLEQAKEAGWQRCYKCKEMVELKEGCNHMTWYVALCAKSKGETRRRSTNPPSNSRCGGQFCMICGSKWKSCECPWFSYETTDDEPAEMQTPSRLERSALERRDGQMAVNSKGATRGTYESGVVPNAVRQRAMSYDEEMVMRRLQERQDGDASRRRRQKDPGDGHHSGHQHRNHARLHHLDVEVEVEEHGEGERDAHAHGRSGRLGERVSVGNATGHFMNDDYRRGPQHIVVPPSPPPAVDTAPREVGSGGAGDYLADVGRARGAYRQDDSADRRLAERFSEARVSLRERASEMSGNPMLGSPPPATTAALVPSGSPLQGLGLQMMPGPMAPMPMQMPSRMVVPPQPPSPPLVPLAHMAPPMTGDGMGYGMPPPRLMRASMSDPSGMVTGMGREPRREDGTRGVRRVAAREGPRSSMMAGLSGAGSGMNRVHEWRNHVAPGDPQDAESRRG